MTAASEAPAEFTVQDDQLLRTSLEAGASLAGLAAGAVKFSKPFTEDELTSRWRSLLYNAAVSRPAAIAMSQAPPPAPSLPVGVAVPAKSLLYNFRVQLAKPQADADSGAAQERQGAAGGAGTSADAEKTHLPTYSEAEEAILDQGLDTPLDEEWSSRQVRRKQRNSRLRQLRELQQLEGRSRAGTDRLMTSQGAVALVLGLLQRFYLRKNEVIVGRSTDDVKVDVDLSLAGNASKVSRQQAFIQRTAEGHFYIRNIGRRPIIVNNFAVEKGMRVRLPEDSYMEVGGIRMLFLPNRSLFPSFHAEKAGGAPAAAAPPPPQRRRTPSALLAGGEGIISPRQLAPPLASPPSAQQLALQAQQLAAVEAAEAAIRPHMPEAQASSADLSATASAAPQQGGAGKAPEGARVEGAQGAAGDGAGGSAPGQQQAAPAPEGDAGGVPGGLAPTAAPMDTS